MNPRELRAYRKIFISYRRADNSTFVHLLRFHILAGGYERKHIFMDFDGIATGDIFVERIRAVIPQSNAMIIAIGPHWLDIMRNKAANFEMDYVRLEVELAIKQGLALFPVCFKGGQIPRESDLPSELHNLLQYNIAFLDEERRNFDKDMEDFLHDLDRVQVEVPSSAKKAEVETAFIDIDAETTRLFELSDSNPIEALDCLNRLLKANIEMWRREDLEPLLPDLQSRAEAIYAQIKEQEKQLEREKRYEVIRNKVERRLGGDQRQALESFWQKYGHYDPANLYERVFGPTTPPRVEVTPPPPQPTSWRDHLTDEQRRLIAIIENPDKTPPERAEAGRRLAEIGDPRPGVGLRSDGLPDMDWVKIEGGEFLMGSDKQKDPQAYDDEIPQKKVPVDTFYISRYPITYQQFEAFIQAGKDGYFNPRWWASLNMPEDHRKVSGDQWQKIANHPRERVSWYDAMAFCTWLSYQWTKREVDWKNPLSWPIRLPTEEEWEKAARGTDGRIYPWGNKYLSGYANIDEKNSNAGEYYLETTTAVGIYPQGKSPYGVYDMSGNVWEWTLTEYQSRASNNITNSVARVVRGGSWASNTRNARAAYRNNYAQDHRNSFVGFRVVGVSAPIINL